MLSFRVPKYDDKDYDNCGNVTVAVLEIDNITIPLCKECLKDLKDDIDDYNDAQFCGRCMHFKASPYGPVHYGGSCTSDQEVDEKDYGNVNYVDYFRICKDGKFKRVEEET